MTLATQTNFADFAGNGVTTVFPYSFRVDDIDDFLLQKIGPDDVVTVVSSGDFSATGLGDPTGGEITYPLTGSPLPLNYTLRIERVVPFDQQLDIANQGGFFPEVVEQQLDRMVMMIQQVNNRATGNAYYPDLNIWTDISRYEDSDPVDEADIGTSDIDDELTQTAALNSAWLAGGGIPETGLLALPANQGRGMFCPGGPDKIYTFIASEMASKFIKAFGNASYRIYEDGTGAYVDEDGVPKNISGTLSQIFPLSSTPQYLYAPPDAGGDRNINFFDAPEAVLLDPRYHGASHIQGNKTGMGLQYGGNVYIEGHMQFERPIRNPTAITVVGRRQLRFAGFGNRLGFFGTENAQRAFTYKPREDGHPNFDNLADANANSVEDIWLRTATPDSGERRWLEKNAVAWAMAQSYSAGQRRTNGGFSYACMVDHVSGAFFIDDYNAGYWLLLNPTTQSSYTGSLITTLGYVGSERVPHFRGDPAYPGAWQMEFYGFGRDNLHNVLDGNNGVAFGSGNAGSSIYVEGVGLLGSHNFSSKNRIIIDTYGLGTRIGDNMIVSKRNTFGGTAVLKYTPRARDMAVWGDGSGLAIGCSDANGANPMTFELENDEPFPAQYGAIIGPANCRIIPLGFTASFIGGYGNFDSVSRVDNDIVIGHLNLLNSTAVDGGRFLIANRHPDTNLTKFGTIGHYLYRNRGAIGMDFLNGGVIINDDVTADWATATVCDQVDGAFIVKSRDSTKVVFRIDDDDVMTGVGGTILTPVGLCLDLMKDFGAVGDNVTDDTAEVQAAIDWARAIGGYVFVPVPPVAYKVTAELDCWLSTAGSPRQWGLIAPHFKAGLFMCHFNGFDKSVFKFQNGANRSAGADFYNLRVEFDAVNSTQNPVGFNHNGVGNPKFDGCSVGASNNTQWRARTIYNGDANQNSFYFGGRSFIYKPTTGITFTVAAGGTEIVASAAHFEAGDIGRQLSIVDLSAGRGSHFTILAVPDTTHATIAAAEAINAFTAMPGQWDHCKCNIAGTTLTALPATGVSAFATSAEVVGLTVFVQRAGTDNGLFRAKVTARPTSNTLTLDTAAVNNVNGVYFTVPPVELGGDTALSADGTGNTNDFNCSQLHIENHHGVGLVAMNQEQLFLPNIKLHGTPCVTDALNSLASAWFSRSDIELSTMIDSRCVTGQGRIYFSALKGRLTFHDMSVVLQQNARLFYEEDNGADGFAYAPSINILNSISAYTLERFIRNEDVASVRVLTDVVNRLGVAPPDYPFAFPDGLFKGIYELGDWSANLVLKGSGTAGTIGFSTKEATFLRDGNKVLASFHLVVNSVAGGPTGDLILTGAPYTAQNLNVQWPVQLGACRIDLGATDYQLVAQLVNNSKQINFLKNKDSTNTIAVPVSAVTTNTVLTGSVEYRMARA